MGITLAGNRGNIQAGALARSQGGGLHGAASNYLGAQANTGASILMNREGNRAQLQATQMGVDASRYGSDNQLRAAMAGVDASRYGADQNTLQARIGADAARYGSDNSLQGVLAGVEASRYGSDNQLKAAMEAAGASRYGSDQNTIQAQIAAEMGRYGADRSLDASRLASEASRFGSMQSRQASDFASRAGLSAANAAQSGQNRRLGMTLDWQREKFNTLNDRFSQLYNDDAGAVGPGGAGESPDFGMPSSVYSPEQIQQEVNAATATNDSRAAGLMRQQREQLAGRGLSSGPLLSALAARIQGQTMGDNADADRQIRLGATEANARQGSAAAGLRADTFASRQQEAIQRQQIGASQRNALLAALAGMG
jgi:hypothetical protein